VIYGRLALSDAFVEPFRQLPQQPCDPVLAKPNPVTVECRDAREAASCDVTKNHTVRSGSMTSLGRGRPCTLVCRNLIRARRQERQFIQLWPYEQGRDACVEFFV
jgi:hypothetical protein